MNDKQEIDGEKEVILDSSAIMYQISSSENEYYTNIIPYFSENNLKAEKLIKKAVVTEVVQEGLPKNLVRFYAEDIGNLTFDLLNGCTIKTVKISDIAWLNETKEDAEQKLRDDLLKFYQLLVPKLIEQLQKSERDSEKQTQLERQQHERYERNKSLLL